MKNISEDIFIDKSATLIKGLQQMDQLGRKLLIVTEKHKYYSILSIGDIQRAIIRENNLQLEVYKALRPEVKVAKNTENPDRIKAHMRERRNEFMPILDAEGNITNIIFWEDLFEGEDRIIPKQVDLPVVIMAGGKGTRLKPLTNVLPKALVPYGEKTILEHIMNRFSKIGCKRFYLSVNHKAQMIEHYLQQVAQSDQTIEFVQESKPLGTAGSLSMLKVCLNETFFVSNCDILVDEDYHAILQYHHENKNAITIVAAIKNYAIPYGTIQTGENGVLTSLQEKPEISFKINTGFYVMEPSILQKIPENTFYNITDLIDQIKHTAEAKIGVFPVSEMSWKDIGTWDEYLNNRFL